jgi:hypothetical protein
MKLVAVLQDCRARNVARVALLLTLTVVFAVMLRTAFESRVPADSTPSRLVPAFDRDHLDPFLPVQWLDLLADRT